MSQHRYMPQTAEDIEKMLDRCGAASVDDLLADIPAELRMKAPYDLPPEHSEIEVRRFFKRLRDNNEPLVCFAGAGCYDKYIPAVIPSLMTRSEFLTAYTPYQPEISQGTLQYIFEYQSMMCSLTGLDVCNASMYDGATATAEAMMMCVAAARKRNRVLIAETVSPVVRQVVATYARYHKVQLDTVPQTAAGVTDREALSHMLAVGEPVAGVIVASPNYWGILEDFTGLADEVHGAKALLVMNCHAADLAVVRTPADWGADIAVGEAQSLGMPMNYGGPGLGYMCCTKALMRKMPGRIVGATTDAEGRRCFVLTLQAREQHIRREKATSNICSNQGIMTLWAAMYLSVMGEKGLREAAELGYAGAHTLAEQIVETGTAELAYPESPFLNEFVVRLKYAAADDVLLMAQAHGILAGVKVDEDKLLIAVTEMRTQDEIDDLVSIFSFFTEETA